MANATQSFEKELEQLKSMYQHIESDIKKETAARIGELIMENQFDEACAVIQHLRDLVSIFDFEEKYTETQKAFAEYSENVFKQEIAPTIFQAEQLKHIAETIQQAAPPLEDEQALEPRDALEASQGNVEWYKQEIKKKLMDKHFRIIREEGDEIQVMKKNKNYHLNYYRPDWTEAEYTKLLDQKYTYKNIGFICRNEEEMQKIRGYVNEWLSTLADAKKKYLVINYTWIQLLERRGEKAFVQTIA